MHSLTLLSVLSLLFSSLVAATPDLAHRRHHRELVGRADGDGRPNMNNSWSEPPVSSASSVSLPASSQVSSSVAVSSSASASSQQRTASSVAPSSSAASPIASVSPSASSAAAQISSAPPSSAAAASSVAEPLSQVASPTAGVSTISVPSSAASVLPSTIDVASSITRSSTSFVTVSRSSSSASSSASVAAAAAADNASSGGLSKSALIAIIVVASVIGVAAIGFTLFRRWKLRPSTSFDKRLNAINFAPKGGDHGDDFYEKSHNRSASASSAERHRKALMAEEFESGPALTAGIPDHDFTAGSTYGMAGAGAGGAAYGSYDPDPFAHNQPYEYQSYGDAAHGYPPQTYDQYGHPVAASQYDHPTQDQDHSQGYADLQRGNSDGSAHQHSHTQPQAQRVTSPQAQVYHDDLDFPESGQYLGRPTGGADGPYAQAAQYRAY